MEGQKIREFQTYLSFDAKREVDKIELIRKFVKEVNERCGKEHAKRIPTVPDIVTEQYLEETFGDQSEQIREYNIPVGISYNSIAPVYLRLLKHTLFAMTGPVENGRIDNMWRVAPNVQYTVGNLNLGIEYELTTVAYGDLQPNGTVNNTHNVSNNRLLLSAMYAF